VTRVALFSTLLPQLPVADLDAFRYAFAGGVIALLALVAVGAFPVALVGAAVLVVLPQALTIFHEYEQALLGLIIMVFMIFLRRGIVPSLTVALAGWRK